MRIKSECQKPEGEEVLSVDCVGAGFTINSFCHPDMTKPAPTFDPALETVIVEELDGTRIPSSTAFAFVYPAFFPE